MYKRAVAESIRSRFFLGKVIILTGARQVGKTTLMEDILLAAESSDAENIARFNCDNPTERELLENKDIDFLARLVGDAKIVFIDEAQKVSTIGQTLKLLADRYRETKQFVVTGSSSFRLLTQTSEPLTGRKYEYTLFPLSVNELYPKKNMVQFLKDIESLLVFGSYPEVVNDISFEEKRVRLMQLSSSYLYRDILEFQEVRNSSMLRDLLKALALQVGSEVSYTEIAKLLGINKITVERYVDLLEKNFIVFRLPPYASKKRRVISKMKKIYFYDLGIRNALINNFNFLDRRDDVGALWENFCIVERMKHCSYHGIFGDNYFWRTYGGSEVDLVEDRDGKLFGYECKWNHKKASSKAPKAWLEYENSSYEIVTPENFFDFV